MFETIILVALLFGCQVCLSRYLSRTNNLDVYLAAALGDIVFIIVPACVALWGEKTHDEVIALWFVATLNTIGLLTAVVIRILRSNN